MICPAIYGPGASIEIAVYLSDKVCIVSREAKSAKRLDNEVSSVAFVNFCCSTVIRRIMGLISDHSQKLQALLRETHSHGI